MTKIFLFITILFFASSLFAQDVASKIAGNYEKKTVSLNFEKPITPKDLAKYEIIKKTDNTIDLKATTNTTTTIQGVKVAEIASGYSLFYSDALGSLLGTVVNGNLEYVLLYIDSKTGKIAAISQTAMKSDINSPTIKTI